MSSSKDIASFKRKVKLFYTNNKRSFPWRETRNPYHILVSEIMLQQTQTSRVAEKYKDFLLEFPTLEALAAAPLRNVLKIWQGLGYNRRALYLKKTAEVITSSRASTLPQSEKELVKLPGVGKNTAGALLSFAYNLPAIFIETNIRRVFLYEFFKDKEGVSDKELLPLITETLDRKNPREWYYALMDYGAHIARTVENPNRKSRHYKKQSTFEGSPRQARGQIIKLLLEKPYAAQDLKAKIKHKHFDTALNKLVKEGVIKRDKNTILLS